MPRVAAAPSFGIGLLLVTAGSMAAGTPSVGPRCIALAVEERDRALIDRCRFDVEIRHCASPGRTAACGRRLAEGSIAAGAMLHVSVADRHRLQLAA